MTTGVGKKVRNNGNSSDGDSLKAGTTAVVNDVDASDSATDVEDVTTQIEKQIDNKLKKVGERIGKRTKSARKTTTVGTKKAKTPSSDDGREVPVKKMKRSTASRPSEAQRRGKGLIEQALSLLPGMRPRDYDKLIDILERMDEFGKVPDIETKMESLMMFLYERYWRVTTSGLENIPDEGRTLIVSNHSGVLPFDGAMMATAIYKFHPAQRTARFLIEDWFGRLPFATEFMNAVGQVRACQENAERLLRQEQLVGVFPEGIKGMAKGFKNRYNVARFGRGGVIRLAIRTRTPLIPCAVVGAEEIYIVLGYANWLGKFFGLPLLPITPTFPWLGPLGVIPMPTKWYIQFGKVIRYDKYDESALKDNVIINRLNRQLRTTIQEMVDSTLKKRRSLFFG